MSEGLAPTLLISTPSGINRMILLTQYTSLKGIRPSQEDRHIVILDLEDYCISNNKNDILKINNNNNNEFDDHIGGYLQQKLMGQYSLFAVLDGHNGDAAAEYVQKQLPFHIFHELRQICKTEKEISAEMLQRAFIRCDIEYLEYCKYNPQYRRLIEPNDKDDGICKEYESSGCTAVVVLLDTSSHKLIVAYCGDTRCILASNNESIPLTGKDHKPNDDDEKKRIELDGRSVKENRLDGGLMVSRAFGDRYFKGDKQNLHPIYMKQLNDMENIDIENAAKMALTVVPQVQNKTINCLYQDQFLVLACDGIFDVMNNNEVIEFLLNKLKQQNRLQSRRQRGRRARGRGNNNNNSEEAMLCGTILELVERCRAEDPSFNLAHDLAQEALYRGSNDNVTVLLLFFAPRQPISTTPSNSNNVSHINMNHLSLNNNNNNLNNDNNNNNNNRNDLDQPRASVALRAVANILLDPNE